MKIKKSGRIWMKIETNGSLRIENIRMNMDEDRINLGEYG